MRTRTTVASQRLTTWLSSPRDVDTANLALDVTTVNAAYQSALQTTASLRQLSLLDFLR